MTAPGACPICGTYHHPHQAHVFSADRRDSDASKSVEVTQNGDSFVAREPMTPVVRTVRASIPSLAMSHEQLLDRIEILEAKVAALESVNKSAVHSEHHVNSSQVHRDQPVNTCEQRKAYRREWMRKKRQKA